MSNDNSRDPFGRSMSMPALLIVLTGFGMLLTYFKFSFLFVRWTDLARYLFFGSGVLILLFGSRRLYTSFSAKTFTRGTLQGPRLQRRFPRPGLVYLVIMIVVFIGAVMGRSNMLILVFALMAGPFVVNGWATYSMVRRCDVQRIVPPNIMAGDRVSVDIVLTNRKVALASWLMAVRDRIAGSDELLEGRVLFARVPARDKRRASYQVRFMGRGRYSFGPIQVSTRFPLGLVERGLVFHCPGEILVHPRVGRLSSSWMRTQLTGSELVETRQFRRGVFNDEFHRLREFRPGDNPRVIHWRTSARQNELIVCEYSQSRDQDLLVLLDLWQPETPGDADLNRVELAVSLAATVCVEYVKQTSGAKLVLVCGGPEETVLEGQSRPGIVKPVLNALALAGADSSADIERLLESGREKRTSGMRTVLITTRGLRSKEPDGENADALSRIDNTVSGNRLSETAKEWFGEIQVIEADPIGVSSFFQMA